MLGVEDDNCGGDNSSSDSDSHANVSRGKGRKARKKNKWSLKSNASVKPKFPGIDPNLSSHMEKADVCMDDDSSVNNV